MRILTILCFIVLIIYEVYSQTDKVVCYWNTDSIYNNGLKGEFYASDINPNICTHIIYNHIWFTRAISLRWSASDQSAEFLKLKTVNPNVKLLVGVGGPSWGTTFPSVIMSTATGRFELAEGLKRFLDDYSGFDGCNIDWQFPARGSGAPEDKDNLSLFLKELKEQLTSSKIISISVAAKNDDINVSYDIPKIAEQVDFININSFDLRGVRDDVATAFHSPYGKDENDRNPEAEWNAESIVSSWTSRGVESSKFTLGIATYGRSFTLKDESNNGVNAAIDFIGPRSDFVDSFRPETLNVIPYAEICYNLNQSDTEWKEKWSDPHYAPYIVKGKIWIGFDDKTSILRKLHLVVDNKLGGINYASLEYDDFAGNCGKKFSLIDMGYEAIVNGNLPDNEVTTVTTPIPGVTTTSTNEESTGDEASIPSTPVTTTTTTITETKTQEPTTTTKIVTQEPTTTTKKTTTTKTTTQPSTGSTDFKTPPVTPNTTQINTNTDETTTAMSFTNKDITSTTSTTTKKSTTTTTTFDFRTPPITPSSTLEPITSTDSEEITTISDEYTTSSEESSGDYSSEYTTSQEEDGATPPSPTDGNNSGEVTDDGSNGGEVNFVCPVPNGNFKHPNTACKYITCSNFVPYVMNCPSYLYYNDLSDRCEYSHEILCD